MRKHKGISQTDLSKAASVFSEIIGRCERSEEFFLLKWLKKCGTRRFTQLPDGRRYQCFIRQENLSRLQDIEKLDSDTKEKIYFVIDNIIQNVKAKKAFAS